MDPIGFMTGYSFGDYGDRIYAGNEPYSLGGVGEEDDYIDWNKSFPEFQNSVNDVALRTVGLGEIYSTDSLQAYDVGTNIFGDIWNAFNTQSLAPSVNTIEAKIQAKVAQFLGMKDTIITMQNDPKVVTTDKVSLQQLYNEQVSLEGNLQSSLALIEQIKLGNRSAVDLVVDITNLSIFAIQMEMHMEEVNDMMSKYEYSVGISVFSGTSIMGFLLIGGVGYLAYKKFK